MGNLTKTRLSEIIDTLNTFQSDLQAIDHVHNQEKFFETMKNFRKFITSQNDTETFELFFHSKYFHDFKLFFSQKNYYYLRALEAAGALKIMTKGMHKHRSFMNLFDAEEIKDRYHKKFLDIKCFDFTKAKTLVCVGCGPLPETMLYIYENTSVEKIIGIDNNYEAVYISGEMINSLGLENIEVTYGDGENFDYKGVDIVYIPNFVEKKNEVINRVVNTSHEEIQIGVLQPTLYTKLLFSDVVLDLHPRLKLESSNLSNTTYASRNMLKLVKYDY